MFTLVYLAVCLVLYTASSFAFSPMFPTNKAVEIPAKRPAILCPAQLSIPEDYVDMIGVLNSRGHQVYGAKLTRPGWILGLLPSFFTREYLNGTLTPTKTLQFYYDGIDAALQDLNREKPDEPFHLIGHSIGGWVARGWLTERASEKDRKRVLSLTTLGTPNRCPPPDTFAAKIDQTRGLLASINSLCPAGLYKNVKYTSVVGTGTEAKLSTNVEEILAFASYLPLGGDKDNLGDGIVPWRVGLMEGGDDIILPNAKHSGFVPTFGKAIQLQDYPWYGDVDSVKAWGTVLDIAELDAVKRKKSKFGSLPVLQKQ